MFNLMSVFFYVMIETVCVTDGKEEKLIIFERIKIRRKKKKYEDIVTIKVLRLIG